MRASDVVKDQGEDERYKEGSGHVSLTGKVGSRVGLRTRPQIIALSCVSCPFLV